MPKPIDSIGPRPEKKQIKPVSEHKAGEVVRPKGSATRAGETVKPKAYVDPHQHETKSNTFVEHSGIGEGKKPKPHREHWYKKLTKKQKLVMGSALVLVLGLGALVWYLSATSQFLKSLNKPRPAAGVFAEVGGETVSIDDYEKSKQAYETFAKKRNGNVGQAGQAAARDLTTYLALKSEATKRGIVCSQETVDRRLTNKYLEQGGKDAYYKYISDNYGWTPDLVMARECSEYIRAELSQSHLNGVDVFGIYIRWDTTNGWSEVEKGQYEEAAKKRLTDEYLPLMNSGASKEEIYRKADINAYTSDAEFDAKMTNPAAPYSRTVEYQKLNEEAYAGFQKYGEGERDIDYVSKLNAGEATPVFKSEVGYYVIYRATNVYRGDVGSIDGLVDSYLQSGKYSNEYYLLPSGTSGERFDLNNPQSSVFDSMRRAVIPTARAANNIGCFTNHRLPMAVEYRDYDTGALLPLSPSWPASVGLSSVGDVQTPCYDEPPAGNFFGVVNIWYTGGAVNFLVHPHVNNPWTFSLSCYTAWKFVFAAPAGYQPVNYGDANQFRVSLLQTNGNWSVQNRASAYPDYYRIPADMYSNIANGGTGYKIEVFLRRVPPPPPPPTFTLTGHKVDDLGNSTGSYSDARVYMDDWSVSDNRQPYTISGIRADGGHSFTSAEVPGFNLTGYRENDTFYAGKYYYYNANTSANGAVRTVDWVYEPQFSGSLTVNCSTITASTSGPAEASSFIKIGGVEVARTTGATLTYTVPDEYKDGLSRQVMLYMEYAGTTSPPLDTKSHRCNPNAVCSSADFTQISGAVDAGQSYNVTLQFTNNGEAYWKDYAPNNQYRLAMIDGSQGFDVMSLSLDMDPVLVKNGEYTAFTVSLTAKAAVTTPTIRVAFQMTRADGATLNNFGTICEATTRFRSQYSPWLRTQNGNVSALGIIVGQGSLKVDGASLGGRRNVGTASGASKDDLNYEATYLAMAQKQNSVGAIGGAISDSGPFCSTNAYVLGRDTAATTADNSASCSFDTYAFRLRHNLADGLKKNGTEVIFKQTKLSYNGAPDACPAAGPNPTGDSRYVKGAASYDGLNLPGLNGLCPTITILNKRAPTDELFTLGSYAASPPDPFAPKGRTTILVDGDLYINANIRNGALPAVTFNRNDFIGLNALPNLGIIVSGDIIVDRDVTQIDASLYAAGKIKTCDLYNPSVIGSDSTTTTTGFKTEQSPAPTASNTTAKLCSYPLSIHGLAVARDGFMFGRNYLDFNGIASRIGRTQFSADFELHPDRSLYFGKPAEDVVYNGLMMIAPPPGFEHVSNPDFSTARYTNDDVQPRF